MYKIYTKEKGNWMEVPGNRNSIGQVPGDQLQPPVVEEDNNVASGNISSERLHAGRSVSVPVGMTRKQLKELYKVQMKTAYEPKVKVKDLNWAQKLVDRVTHFYSHQAYTENLKHLKNEFVEASEKQETGVSGYEEAQEYFKAYRVLYEAKSHETVNVNTAFDVTNKMSQKMQTFGDAGKTFMKFVKAWATLTRSLSSSVSTAGKEVVDVGVSASSLAESAVAVADLATAGILGAVFLPVHVFTLTSTIKAFLDTKAQRDGANTFVQNLKQEKDLSEMTQGDFDAMDAGRMLRNQHDLWDAGMDNIDEVQSIIASAATTTCIIVGTVATGSIVGVELGVLSFAAGATISAASLGATVGVGIFKKCRNCYKVKQKKQWNEAGPNNPKLREKAVEKANKELRSRIKQELKVAKTRSAIPGEKVTVMKEEIEAMFRRPDYQTQLKTLENIIYNEERVATPKYKETRIKAEKQIMGELRAKEPSMSSAEMRHKINNMQKEISDRTEGIIHAHRMRRDKDYMIETIYDNILKEQNDYLENARDDIDMSQPSAKFINFFLGGVHNLTGREHIKIVAESPSEEVAKAYLKKMFKMA